MSGATLELLRGCDAMAAARDRWLGLEAVATYPCFFQSFAWCMHVADVRTRLDASRYEPMLAVLSEDEAALAVWPLSRQRVGAQWELANLDDPFGQIGGLLARTPEAADTLVEMLIGKIRSEGLAASLRFERVIEGGSLARALLARGAGVDTTVEAPFIDLASCASFEQLHRSRNKKTMKNLRNANNRLARHGQFQMVRARDAGAIARIAETALMQRTDWLRETGQTARAFRTAGNTEVVLGHDKWGLSSQRMAFALQLDGRQIAGQTGFVHGGRYYAYLSGMDWAFSELAPGRVHLADVIAAACGDGLCAVEMLTPASPYKLIWTDTSHRLSDISLALTAAGRLRRALWDRSLRPAIKAVYLAMPQGVRSVLLGRVADRTTAPSDG